MVTVACRAGQICAAATRAALIQKRKVMEIDALQKCAELCLHDTARTHFAKLCYAKMCVSLCYVFQMGLQADIYVQSNSLENAQNHAGACQHRGALIRGDTACYSGQSQSLQCCYACPKLNSGQKHASRGLSNLRQREQTCHFTKRCKCILEICNDPFLWRHAHYLLDQAGNKTKTEYLGYHDNCGI